MKLKKILGLTAVVGTAALALSACGNAANPSTSAPAGSTSAPAASASEPAASSSTTKEYTDDELLYDEYFGEYEDEVNLALSATDTNERYYHFAKAEAVLYDQALILPVNTQGGRYTLTRIGIGSAPYALWGTDNNKLKDLVVATDLIKASDRATMKTKLLAERAAAAPYSHYSDGSHTTTYNAATELTTLGYTVKKAYNSLISEFPETYDLTNTYRANDSEIVCNFTDYLVQYDVAGNIVPALAQSWTRSADGKTYTFNLRQGAKWVDAAGEEHGEVKAQDFVFGIKLAGDNGMTSYMLEKVKNYDECAEAEDFSNLGVTAVNDYTLKIELSEACDYFLTYLTYNTFTPVQEEYYNQKGENYGSTYNDILYCGAFVCSGVSDKVSLTMRKNAKYWDAANTTLDTVTFSFEDGKNERTMYDKLINGTYDGLSLSAARIEFAKNDNLFDEYAYVSDTNATSYFGGFNLNRMAYKGVSEDPTSFSTQTDAEKALAKKALRNTNFRRAILAGLDKQAYNVPVTGADASLFSLRNTYVPYDYVTLTGTAGSYQAGTQYGDIVYNELKSKGTFSYVTSLKDGVNAYYNADKAKEFLATAWAELQLAATDKVVLDYPVDNTNTVSVQQSNVLKQVLETVSEGKIQINLVLHKDYRTYLYSNYFPDDARNMNYDFDISSGWGPDHGDPFTYLNTLMPYGDMIRLAGINAHESTK